MTASPAPVLKIIYDKVIKFYKKFQKFLIILLTTRKNYAILREHHKIKNVIITQYSIF